MTQTSSEKPALAKSNNIKEKELKAAYKSGNRDFSRVDLSKADLHKARLKDINLSQAYLCRAILNDAHFRESFF